MASRSTSFGVIFALKKLENSHRKSHHDVLTMTDQTADVHSNLNAYNLLYTLFTPTMAHCGVGLCWKVDLSLYFVLQSGVFSRLILLIGIK